MKKIMIITFIMLSSITASALKTDNDNFDVAISETESSKEYSDSNSNDKTDVSQSLLAYNNFSKNTPYYYNIPNSNSNQRISDAQLMKDYIINRANMMKKKSIIGGAILGGVGIATFLTIYLASASNDNLSDESIGERAIIGGCIGGAFIAGGAVWIGCAHHKANKMIESVRYLSIIEPTIFSNNNSCLTASLDYVNSNGINKTKGIGVSLKLSF